MADRKPLSKRVRFSVFARDGFTCRYCGRQADSVLLVVDHVIPVAQGGTNDEENLITACEPCNQGKADKRIGQAAPTEMDRLRLNQEAKEQARVAAEAAAAMRSRDSFHQELVNLWCKTRESERVDGPTIRVIAAYAREHGIEQVARWVDVASGLYPHAQDRYVGRVVSAMRREWQHDGGLQAALAAAVQRADAAEAEVLALQADLRRRLAAVTNLTYLSDPTTGGVRCMSDTCSEKTPCEACETGILWEWVAMSVQVARRLERERTSPDTDGEPNA